jgi:predicted RNA binding protein YcfA (HicA-like mRNA interferase family)
VKKEKLLQKIMSGSKNIKFSDMVNLLEAFGFKLDRTKGSHHIFIHSDVGEIINLQNVRDK